MNEQAHSPNTVQLEPGLLSEPGRGFDWAELEALAERLSSEPNGWQPVAEAFALYQRRALEGPELDEVTWLKAPAVLSLIGRQSDEATRRAIAAEMIAGMDRYGMDHDFGHEVLLYSTQYLGPSIMPEVLAKTRVADPEEAGWFTLLSLHDLAAHPEATGAEQAMGIEACEVLFGRAINGEIPCDSVECVGWPLVALNHTPSIGLVKQALDLMEKQALSNASRFLGNNELRHIYRALTGEKKPDHDPGDLGRLKDGLEPLIRQFWSHYEGYQADQEEGKQRAFEENVLMMEGILPPPDEMDGPFSPPISKKKVGRNEPCPCGSGKKHKKCCGPRRR